MGEALLHEDLQHSGTKAMLRVPYLCSFYADYPKIIGNFST